jgi:3-dehydroquinate synthase II
MSSSESEKDVVLDVTDSQDLGALLRQAKEAGIRRVISRIGYSEESESADGIVKIKVSEGRGNERTAAWVRVAGASDVQKAVDASANGHAFVVVECANWKIIPLENLIADFRRNNRKIYAYMKDRSDIEIAFSILEKGVDGIVIPAEALGATSELVSSLRSADHLPLTKAKVTKVVDVGNGERACIDTASQLKVGEGLLIGSTAGLFFLVHSETVPSEYIPTREFRVNAGAIHSYILGEGSKTRYLSELKASDKVMTVMNDGRSREVVVGRVKIERRPLVMVEVMADGEHGTAMLQKAETIRLIRGDGTPVSVTDLKVGEEVMVHMSKNKARHFGGEVDEFILER